GIHCIAGKVTPTLGPLSSRLNSGDQVEILTSQSQMPQAEWADFLVTARARTRLRAALRKMRAPIIARGGEMLREWLAEHNIPDTNAVISKILGTYHVDNRETLCYQLGNEEIMLGDFLVKGLKKPAEAASKPGIFSKILSFGKRSEAAPVETPKINPKEIYVLRSDENGNANFITADCCSPIPGDDTLGFITDSQQVEIHTLDCPHAQVLKAGYGPRIVATRWENSGARFPASIHIEGIDRHGILQELIQMLSTHLAIDIRSLNIEARGEIFVCDLAVKVASADIVRDICEKSLTINGITSATRIQ
ncbi:MAG: GTP pyrophosphokinase, partial [Muribaculaceae bacterium]|nr:GTP pyrophosphokinase [Muribaculaceae bacterium]